MEEKRFTGARAVGFSLVVGFGFVPLSGCTGGDDPGLPTPPQGCRDFVVALCSRYAECELPSERARVYQDCTFSLELSLDCEQIVKLGSSYEQCLVELERVSCERLQGGLPAMCNGVLLHD